MEQSLRMKHSQHLAMTMHLQQAIQMLQMSTQELRDAVEKEYMENPVLELDYSSPGGDEEPGAERGEDISPLTDYMDGEEHLSEHFADYENRPMEPRDPMGITLEDEIMEQVEFSFSDEDEKAIAVFMVGSMDERGYLMVSIPEIMRVTGAEETAVRKVLRRIQEFEPAGIGARDLKECLRIQAERRGIYEGLVAALIDRHLEAVADSRIKDIAAAERERPEDVQMAVDILRTLNPKPGNSYGADSSGYIRPDVFVRKEAAGYVVTLNDDELPKLHISKLYQNAEHFDEEAKKYIHQRVNAALWFLRSIEQRRQTICHVMEEIVHRQRPCMEQGMKFLRPMTMKQVADGIGVHESTVSRVAANKYVELPWGIVPLRKFFAANLGRCSAEEEYAAVQVKAAMEEFLRGEDPKKPLSDQKLAKLLSERGMKISRRTVMKYREQMGYASSMKRKRYG